VPWSPHRTLPGVVGYFSSFAPPNPHFPLPTTLWGSAPRPPTDKLSRPSAQGGQKKAGKSGRVSPHLTPFFVFPPPPGSLFRSVFQKIGGRTGPVGVNLANFFGGGFRPPQPAFLCVHLCPFSPLFRFSRARAWEKKFRWAHRLKLVKMSMVHPKKPIPHPPPLSQKRDITRWSGKKRQCSGLRSTCLFPFFLFFPNFFPRSKKALTLLSWVNSKHLLWGTLIKRMNSFGSGCSFVFCLPPPPITFFCFFLLALLSWHSSGSFLAKAPRTNWCAPPCVQREIGPPLGTFQQVNKGRIGLITTKNRRGGLGSGWNLTFPPLLIFPSLCLDGVLPPFFSFLKSFFFISRNLQRLLSGWSPPVRAPTKIRLLYLFFASPPPRGGPLFSLPHTLLTVNFKIFLSKKGGFAFWDQNGQFHIVLGTSLTFFGVDVFHDPPGPPYWILEHPDTPRPKVGARKTFAASGFFVFKTVILNSLPLFLAFGRLRGALAAMVGCSL